MKKSLLLTTCMAALLGIGVFAGVSAGKDAKVEKAEAGFFDSKIYLQLNTNDWKYSGSKIALYMFNNSVSKSAWGNYVYPDGTQKYIEYDYSELDFEPTGCIAFRIDEEDSHEKAGQWCFDNDRGNTNIWSTTNDITFNDVVYLGNYYPSSKWTESGSYTLEATLTGGDSDDWSVKTVDYPLTNFKLNPTKTNLELYGEAELGANKYFKVVENGNWIGTFSTEDSLNTVFSNTGSGNITNSKAGVFEFFFSFTDNKVHIADPVTAAADEWAQNFNIFDEDPQHTGCNQTKAAWASLRDSYNTNANKYKTAFTSLFTSEPHVAHDYSGELSYIGQAMQRYDYVLQLYGVGSSNTDAGGYQDFINRAGIIPSLKGSFVLPASESVNNGATIAIIVTFVSVATAVGFIFFKKKKITK